MASAVEIATQASINAEFNKWWNANSLRYFGPNASDRDRNVALILFCVGAEWGMDRAAAIARTTVLG